MKEFLSVFMSGCLILTTSCSTQTKNERRPAQTQPMTQEQVQQTDQEFETKGNQASAEAGKGDQGYSQAKQNLDTKVNSLMASKTMNIRDYDGNAMSMAEFKANPSQGFILLKGVDGYNVLKTTLDVDMANTIGILNRDAIDITYEVFAMDGDIADFKGEDLGEPVLEDGLTVNPKNPIASYAAAKALIKRIGDSDYAHANTSMLDKIENFLFPTAYADLDRGALLITAIIFTSVAVLAYLFGFAFIGDYSAIIAIVMWLLYAFED